MEVLKSSVNAWIPTYHHPWLYITLPFITCNGRHCWDSGNPNTIEVNYFCFSYNVWYCEYLLIWNPSHTLFLPLKQQSCWHHICFDALCLTYPSEQHLTQTVKQIFYSPKGIQIKPQPMTQFAILLYSWLHAICSSITADFFLFPKGWKLIPGKPTGLSVKAALRTLSKK